MGCDIHLFVEKRAGGAWVDITDRTGADEPERDYILFACLAGVRNRTDLTPISELRGVPDDASARVRDYLRIVFAFDN